MNNKLLIKDFKSDKNKPSNDNNEKLPQGLPENISVLSHQIAGHYHDEVKKKLGILSHVDGSVLKPITDDDIRGLREKQFYETVFQENNNDGDLLTLKTFIPEFIGLFETVLYGKNVAFMKLRDITSDFSCPSVMDVKIGQKTYDPEASEEKKQKEIKKYLSMSEIGFRILGMRVYNRDEKRYLCHGKEFGLNLNKSTVIDGLATFLPSKERNQETKNLVEYFIADLRSVKAWFEAQRRFSFYSSSLLFVYGEEVAPLTRPLVKMIDFAHVYHRDTTDENYLYGLNSLIECFQELLNDLLSN